MIMKYILPFLLLIATPCHLVAQEEMNEAPEPSVNTNEYLPSAGDFAIGVNALPFIEFAGNAFSGHDYRNTLNLGNAMLVGKYYLSSDAAIRAEVYLNNDLDYNRQYVQDDAHVGEDPNAQVEDLYASKLISGGLGVGYQVYRGYERLRGSLSVVTFVAGGRNLETYKWGNEMTPANTNPSSTNWYGAGMNPPTRNLEEKDFGFVYLGAGLTAGVEYYLFPGVCLGGEMGMYVSAEWSGQEHYTYQTVEAGEVTEYTIAADPRDLDVALETTMYDADNTAGRLYLLFHF